MTPARQRVLVWGTGALVTLVAAALYRWSPIASAAAGWAAALGTAFVLDSRRPQ
jgi:hypothetical protein